MTAIDLRFATPERLGGDPLGGWTDGIDTSAASSVHGIDLTGVSRPRAVRAVVHQRMTRLQLDLLRRPTLRRILVVVRMADVCDVDRACAGMAVAAASVHHRIEMTRGVAFGLAVLAIPLSAPARDVRRVVAEGAPTVPDGPACVSWAEAREWGLRAAVSLQTL